MAEFLNVYNFIPFPKKKASAHKDDGAKHTGVITYTITTKTPLFIPNSSNDDAFVKQKEVPEHKSYDFYSYREMKAGTDYTGLPAMPIIPGSELRGMVRNIYETLTDSCMGVLNGNKKPVLRTGAIFSPGLLVKKNGGYAIEAAHTCVYKGRQELEYKEGQKVYVEDIESKTDRGISYWVTYNCKSQRGDKCNTEGYFMKGEPFSRKAAYRAIVRGGRGGVDSITKDDLERLKAVIKSYQATHKEDAYKEYEKELFKYLANGNNGEKFPVYYSVVGEGANKLVYLSPASVTKELSYHEIKDFAGDVVPCASGKSTCPACDLFGKIGDQMTASKIRFTDAKPEVLHDVKDYYQEIVTLPALGEPKLGAVEFYLKRPDDQALYWTYDYYVLGKKDKRIKMPELRGRKYYWHQPKVKKLKSVEKTKLNKTVRPVTPEITFTGKVYYDGISDRQLEQLKWILNGGTEKDDLMYKLGTGKPFGMGSVKCQVTDIKERKVSLTSDGIAYVETPGDTYILSYDDEMLGFSKIAKQEFLFMSDFDAVNKIANGKDIMICYPITENQALNGDLQTEGFQWFVENRRNKGKTGLEAELPQLRFNSDGKLVGSLLMPCLKGRNSNKPRQQGGYKGNWKDNRSGKSGKKPDYRGGKKY